MKKNPFKPAVMFLCFLMVIISSCSKENEEQLPTEPVPINLTTDQIALIGSENAFAFDIFSRIAENPGNSNMIFSPLSISVALSMTLNGAAGETREAMLEALRVNGLPPETINKSYKDLIEALLSVDKRILISIANSVWTEDNFDVKKNFIDILVKYYSAESGSFDINDPDAHIKINQWIQEKTNNLITDMLERLEDNDVMLLVNAIYFKGKWKSQFDKSNTVSMSFYKSDGTSVMVPMMKQTEKFMAYSGNDFILAEFPYGQGNYVMDVILPDPGVRLEDFISGFTESDFRNWISQLREMQIDLSFPRFKYGFKKKLKEILSDMGMAVAFTDAADFSNISEAYDLLINEVTHQAFIETNEEGTEAAAATVVEIGLTSAGDQPLVLKLDHPFIYLIRETTTGSVIFMGIVADPSSS